MTFPREGEKAICQDGCAHAWGTETEGCRGTGREGMPVRGAERERAAGAQGGRAAGPCPGTDRHSRWPPTLISSALFTT